MPAQPEDRKSSKTFTYRASNGVSVTLPKMGSLPSGVLRRHRKLNEVDFVFSIVEEVCSAKVLAEVDKVPLGEINDLFKSWTEDSGVTPGE